MVRLDPWLCWVHTSIRKDPLSAAEAAGAETVQFFLGDPQGWKKPPPHPHADALRATELTLYIDAPYLVNVSSANNIHRRKIKIMAQHAEVAADIGATGLIVHGGHLTANDDPAVGLENWRKACERAEAEGGLPLPILIENTAGGHNAMARRFDRIAMLWDVVGQYEPGFVLDTCHAWAAGEELVDIVDRVMAITGRIDWVHANNSRDAVDSGADWHANCDSGTFDSDLIASV